VGATAGPLCPMSRLVVRSWVWWPEHDLDLSRQSLDVGWVRDALDLDPRSRDAVGFTDIPDINLVHGAALGPSDEVGVQLGFVRSVHDSENRSQEASSGGRRGPVRAPAAGRPVATLLVRVVLLPGSVDLRVPPPDWSRPSQPFVIALRSRDGGRGRIPVPKGPLPGQCAGQEGTPVR